MSKGGSFLASAEGQIRESVPNPPGRETWAMLLCPTLGGVQRLSAVSHSPHLKPEDLLVFDSTQSVPRIDNQGRYTKDLLVIDATVVGDNDRTILLAQCGYRL